MKIDGVQLLGMIRNNEIEDGTKIKMYYNYEPIETLILYNNDLKNERTGNSIIDSVEYCIGVFVSDKHKFKILENEETIDIQEIQELEVFEERVTTAKIIDTINDLIKAVKQLDKNKVDK